MNWFLRKPREPDAVWFARRRDPRRCSATDDAFQTWSAAEPQNVVRYAQCELAWERSAELSHDPEIQQWLDNLEARIRRAGQSTTHRQQFHTYGHRTRDRRILQSVAAAALLLIGGWITMYELSAPVYQTAIGEQRDVRLPDGSRVSLNTATRMIVRYSHARRTIELKAGEAVFDVHKDPTRPFEVMAGASIARAVGTKFDVEREDDRVTVSVLEGVVELIQRDEAHPASAQSQRLRPILEGGQAAAVTSGGALSSVMPAKLQRIQSWEDRKLDFESESLADAIAEVNRYTTRPLVLGQADLRKLRISGVFRIDALEGFNFALQQSFGLRVIDNGDEWLVLPPSITGTPQSTTINQDGYGFASPGK